MCLRSRTGPPGSPGFSGLPRARASSTDRHCGQGSGAYSQEAAHFPAGSTHTSPALPLSHPPLHHHSFTRSHRRQPPPITRVHMHTQKARARGPSIPGRLLPGTTANLMAWGLTGEAALRSWSCLYPAQPPTLAVQACLNSNQRRVGSGLQVGPGCLATQPHLDPPPGVCPEPFASSPGVERAWAGGPIGWGSYLSTRPVGAVHTVRQCI